MAEDQTEDLAKKWRAKLKTDIEQSEKVFRFSNGFAQIVASEIGVYSEVIGKNVFFGTFGRSEGSRAHPDSFILKILSCFKKAMDDILLGESCKFNLLVIFDNDYPASDSYFSFRVQSIIDGQMDIRVNGDPESLKRLPLYFRFNGYGKLLGKYFPDEGFSIHCLIRNNEDNSNILVTSKASIDINQTYAIS